MICQVHPVLFWIYIADNNPVHVEVTNGQNHLGAGMR